MRKSLLNRFSVPLVMTAFLTPLFFAYSLNATDAPTPEKSFFSGMRQITFVGPRAGEGYFSRDGKQMVFQSERDEKNPFYQIYLMNLETGLTKRISSGVGQTTCAWIHPTEKKVMYSSTHLDKKNKEKVDSELAQRKSGMQKKYSWNYDENYDIFESNFNGTQSRRLTTEKGYDAEGSYSPDGKWIAFASNRAGYTGKLSEEDQKIFEKDPSYLMDIYIMKSDGSGVKQLTTTKGYDGGPFFSQDGKKIVWRRFAANGQNAEIYSMNIDGSKETQLTKLGVMSWAPYFHPSGEYVIFASNLLGYSNFELFIVDSKGKSQPVRVTNLEGFDGLPVFSPDGKKLSWTRRNEKGDSQIYMADWNHEQALKALGLNVPKPTLALSAYKKEIIAQDVRRTVEYLASEELQGRMTGSTEEQLYMNKLKNMFENMGYKTQLQEFPYIAGIEIGSNNQLQWESTKAKQTSKLTAKKDFIPLSFSRVGDLKPGSLVFAGYGIVAPASDKFPSYDSYKDLDVTGKWVLVLSDIPEDIGNDRRIYLNVYSRLQHKALMARQRGALGLLIADEYPRTNLDKVTYDGTGESDLSVIRISHEAATNLLKSSGFDFLTIKDSLDKGDFVSHDLSDTEITGKVDLQFQHSHGLNLIASLNNKNETILLGAHGDHIGKGSRGISLAKDSEKNLAHLGADDNASGVSAILEIAHLYATNPQLKNKLTTNLQFAVWSGEEIGLLGSNAYLKNNKTKIKAYLNLDMVGRLRENLIIQGTGSAKEWTTLLEQVGPQAETSFSLVPDPYVPSDAMAFYLKKIPSLSFFTGAHAEYHTPRDRAETLNYDGTVRVANTVVSILDKVITQRLTYNFVESSKKKMEGRSFRIYLGTIPDYSQETSRGVRISGTTKESPADKAGLKEGDVIIEIAKTKIENIYDYVYCLQAIKPDVSTMIKVVRAGKTLEFPIIPALKE